MAEPNNSMDIVETKPFQFRHPSSKLPPIPGRQSNIPLNQQLPAKPHKPHQTASHIKKMNIKNERNMQVALRDDHEIATVTAHKPQFINNLEAFLGQELQALDADSDQPNEVRLQAHREVFEYLIENFKTYKPLLASIKNEYEMMVDFQSTVLKQLQPLEQMLTTVQDQCDMQIIKHREKEKQDMLTLLKENDRLKSVIDDIKNDQFALLTQVDRLEERLTDQYGRYRDEADARKLLVSDINDLRSQQEELIYQQQQASNRDESEDPVLIRLALKKAREIERDATGKLNHMLANYGDVLPRIDIENLQKVYDEVEDKLDVKEKEFTKLKGEHDELLHTHKQIIKQRDEFYQESERLRQNATPRPTWDRCGQYIPAGEGRWEEVTQGKSSDEIVTLLLKELAGSGTDQSVTDFFEGKGKEEGVPAHLRFEGQIKNRKLGRRDVILLIKDVWKEKDASDSHEAGKTRQPLSEFLVSYLATKFTADNDMVKEWCYNVEEACQRLSGDEKIHQFYGILHNEIDQELYFTTLQNIVLLLKSLTKANEGHEPFGVFSPAEFKVALQNIFGPEKADEELEKLKSCALSELDDGDVLQEGEEPEPEEMKVIEFTRLFFEEFGGTKKRKDDEGKFGPFVDELRKQIEDERKLYVDDLMNIVQETPSDGDLTKTSTKASSTQGTPDDIQRAFATVDPNLEMNKREEIISWVFRIDKTEFDSVEPLELETIRLRLLSKSLKRMTPRAV